MWRSVIGLVVFFFSSPHQFSHLCNRHHSVMDNVNLILVDHLFEKKSLLKAKKRCVASWCFLLICTGNL